MTAAGALLAGTSAQAATILSSDFTGVSKNSTTGVASGFSWDTVSLIDTPATSLTFVDGGKTTTVGFHDVTANEIDVNNNMTAGGWDTEIDFQLDSSTSSFRKFDLGYAAYQWFRWSSNHQQQIRSHGNRTFWEHQWFTRNC